MYTNTQSAGAFRGYGAPQGIFAVESAVNELAARLNMNPAQIREINMVREGNCMHAYYDEFATSCALDRCLAKARQMIGWDEKYPCKDIGNNKVRSVGMAIAMQGSGISGVDVGGATVKLTDEGRFSLVIGAADMGTGCDTILAQMVAECMECTVDDVTVYSADSDMSPYDSGSYASSTTYVTGNAVVRACETLKNKICTEGAVMLGVNKEDVVYENNEVRCLKDSRKVSLEQIATASMCGSNDALQVTETASLPSSPPPFMVGMVETEIDRETGELKIIDYVGVVDCGTVINENLARVQTEGGIAQGIGMALYENITYSDKGSIFENSFMNYKIPTREDIGNIRVAFESSYEKSGPFGAKSIGELVINTPCPAIAHAIYNATGTWLREVPFTPEKILGAFEHVSE